MELLNYIGKFHPVVLHLPIGALYLTFCLVLLEKFFKNNRDWYFLIAHGALISTGEKLYDRPLTFLCEI